VPTYTFKNTKTGKVEELSCLLLNTINLRKTILIWNNRLQAVNIVSGVAGMGSMKNDHGWKDESRIAEAHPTSEFAERYGKRNQLKMLRHKQVLEKHRKRQSQQKKGSNGRYT
jgi:hypothetical protein